MTNSLLTVIVFVPLIGQFWSCCPGGSGWGGIPQTLTAMAKDREAPPDQVWRPPHQPASSGTVGDALVQL